MLAETEHPKVDYLQVAYSIYAGFCNFSAALQLALTLNRGLVTFKQCMPRTDEHNVLFTVLCINQNRKEPKSSPSLLGELEDQKVIMGAKVVVFLHTFVNIREYILVREIHLLQVK